MQRPGAALVTQKNGPSAGRGTEAACVGTPDWRANRGEGLPAEVLALG
jgi:hypothetical protein